MKELMIDDGIHWRYPFMSVYNYAGRVYLRDGTYHENQSAERFRKQTSFFNKILDLFFSHLAGTGTVLHHGETAELQRPGCRLSHWNSVDLESGELAAMVFYLPRYFLFDA